MPKNILRDHRCIVLFLIAFVVYTVYSIVAVTLGTDPFRLMDAKAFLDPSYEIAVHGHYSSTQILPSAPIAFATIFMVFGTFNYVALAIFQSAATAATVVMTAEVAAMFRRQWFWPAGVLMAVTPNVWIWSGIFMGECVMLFFVALGQLAILKASRSGSWASLWIPLAGLSFSAAYLSRPAMILVPALLLIAAIVLFLLRWNSDRKSAFASIAILLVSFTALSSIHYFRNYQKTGHFAYSTQSGRATQYLYTCLMQKWGCGRSDRSDLAYYQKSLEEKLSQLTDEQQSDSYYVSKVKKELFRELLQNVPILNFITAPLGGAVKVLTHTSLKDMLLQFNVPFTYSLFEIIRTNIILKPNYPSDVLLFIATIGIALVRAFQIAGLWYFLKTKDWRSDGALLFIMSVGMVGTGFLLGNPRYLVPAEPFLAVLAIAGADFLLRAISEHKRQY